MYNRDLPEFEKPVAINLNPRNSLKSPYHSKKIHTVKQRIIKYVMSDCNSNSKIIKKNNIKLLVDQNTQRILITAENGGRMCLSNLNSGIVQNIANEEDLDFLIKIDR